MNKLNNNPEVYNGKWPGRYINAVYIFVFSVFLLLTGCDRTVQYKELKIVTFDKIGTAEPNNEIDEPAKSALEFFNYQKGDKISYYPKNIILERLDYPFDDVKEDCSNFKTSTFLLSKNRPSKLSAKRGKDMINKIKNNDDFFETSQMLYIDKLDKLDEFIFDSDITTPILIFNKNFSSEDNTLTINNIEFDDFYNDPEKALKEIEKLLLKASKKKGGIDNLSLVIILMPEGKLTPDTVLITNPTSVSGAQRIAQYIPEDDNYEFIFGPFMANTAEPDSVSWELIEKAGYEIKPEKGKSDTKIILTTTDNSGTGFVRILATAHKAGMVSKPEEILYTFSLNKAEVTKIESVKKAKTESDKQAQIERDRQAKAERERQAQIERDKQAKAERDKQAQIERDKQAKAERDKQAQIERDKQAKAERDKQAQIERDKQAQAERDRQAQIERDKQAQAERDKRAQLEREKQEQTKKDPCPPVSEIISVNDQRQNIIEDFITEVNHIWGSSDPANIPLYKEEAKKAIAMIPGYKVECSALGNSLDRFLNELGAKKYINKPEIQSRFDDCGIIDGIVIKVN
jgi:hypothetical protein